MLPFDLKLGQVGSNYMRFFKELGKTPVTHPQPTWLLTLCSRCQREATGQQWGTLEMVPCPGCHCAGLGTIGFAIRGGQPHTLVHH